MNWVRKFPEYPAFLQLCFSSASALLQLSIPHTVACVWMCTWGSCSLPPELLWAAWSQARRVPNQALGRGCPRGQNSTLLLSNDSIQQASQESAQNDVITKDPAPKMCPANKHADPSQANL